MSTSPPPEGRMRSAAERAKDLNERIRALWIGGRGHPAVGLNKEQAAEYHRLLAELRQVERGDVVEAA